MKFANDQNILKAMFFFTLLLLTNELANAHALEQTSARITLRDGQIEIRILANIDNWQEVLQDSKAWLLGDIDGIMPNNLSKKENTDFLSQLLVTKTQIRINKKKIPLNVRSFTDRVKAGHSEYKEIILIGKHSENDTSEIAVVFPKSLGDVHASLVRPKYQVISAGKESTF